MIGTRRFGRLGNALYQMAAVIGLARKHGVEYSACGITNDNEWNPIVLRHLINPKWQQGREDVLINENWNRETQYEEIPYSDMWDDCQVVLNGYYQSYKFFDHCRDEVIKAFDYPYEMKKGIVSVHIRRGDYLIHYTRHPVVTLEYLNNAIEIMQDKGYSKFLFCSDDNKWVLENLASGSIRIRGKHCWWIHEGTPEAALVMMANCEHQICSNSSMALWGAELNQNENKIVIVPHEDNWFGYDNKKMTVKDLYRPEWIQIKYTPIYEL